MSENDFKCPKCGFIMNSDADLENTKELQAIYTYCGKCGRDYIISFKIIDIKIEEYEPDEEE